MTGTNNQTNIHEIKSLLEVDKGDSRGELVFLKIFHDSSQDVDLMCTAATWAPVHKS